MSRQFQILGALSAERFAPLLADEVWAGRSRRVVLTRPEADAVAPLASVQRPGVVVEGGRVVLSGTEYGVVPWAEGRDLHQIREAGPLSEEQVAHLEARIRGILDGLPVSHGRLNGGAVRVDGAGQVSLVDWRGQGDDGPALQALLDDLRAEDGDDAAALGWSERMGEDGPPLWPHALSGQQVQEGAPDDDMPARVRTAMFAGFTTVLGFLAGWTLRP